MPPNNNNTNINQCASCRLAACCIPAGLDSDILQSFTQLQFKSRLLAPGEHLYCQGDHHQNLFTVRSGALKSYLTQRNGDTFIMGFYFPPDLFGWEFIDEKQTSTSVVALDYTNVCEIPISQFEEIIQKIPQVERQIFKMVSSRIHRDNNALLRTNAAQRVAQFLLQLLDRQKQINLSTSCCQLVMPHQDIANYLRMAPETFSRTLRSFQQKKLITVEKRMIDVINLPMLNHLAGVETRIPETI